MPKQALEQPIILRKQAGASLISLLVAVSIIGIIAYNFIHSLQSLQSSQRNHEASMAARDIEQVILSTIVRKQIDYINNNKCKANIATYFDNIAIGTATNIRQRPPVFKGLDRGSTIGAPTSATNSVHRCNSTKSFEGASAADSTAHYHCLRIETSAPADTARHTFTANLGAFIEVFVKIKNVATNSPLTCNSAAAGTDSTGTRDNLGNGIEVYYNLHWTIPDSVGKIIYKAKAGSVRVAL